MKPAAFAYHAPDTIEALVALLAEHGLEGRILAGGQSLVAAMNFRLARPTVILDINKIAMLDRLGEDGGGITIGALTRHAAFHAPLSDTPLAKLLSDIVRYIAHDPIRRRGTFAGSLAHADPASEWCLAATVLDARVTARSPRGKRVIAASDFFKGTFTTALEHDEVLTDVFLPALAPDATTGFAEFSRRSGDFALAMALAVLRIDGGIIREARLGIGGVADKAIRLDVLERRLLGQRAAPSLFHAVAAEAANSIEPAADIHASPAFRRDLIAAMVQRALHQAAS
jgi:carbon-monoxide dehydrogenase medium subunit